jgi:hypothetical protein
LYSGLLGTEGSLLVQRLSSHLADGFFSLVTDTGIGAAYLLLPLLYWLWSRRKTAALGVLLLLSAYVNSFLKYLVATPRPSAEGIRILRHEASPSFPSGHSQASAAFWGYLAYLLRRKWAWAVAAAIIFLVGVSRVYLGAHYPADVIGGWFIGLLLVAIAIGLEKAGCCHGLSEKVSWGWFALAVVAISALLCAVHPRAGGVVPIEVSRIGGAAGLLIGWIMAEAGKLPDRLEGSFFSQAAFVVVGLVSMAATFRLTGSAHPAGGSLGHVCLESLRWFAMTWEVAFLIPWLSKMTERRGR